MLVDAPPLNASWMALELSSLNGYKYLARGGPEKAKSFKIPKAVS